MWETPRSGRAPQRVDLARPESAVRGLLPLARLKLCRYPGEGSPMSTVLRRLPLSRLLLLCGLVLVLGVSATAIAFALGTGPTPPPKPLAEAVHDALSAPPVEGVSASVQLTNHLLEGANL